MIKKVAAIIIKNDCILSVSKKKAPDFICYRVVNMKD